MNTSSLKRKRKILEHYFEYITPERREKFERISAERTRYITVVLEDIHKAHNISAVLRSCDCFGIQDVHVIEQRNRFMVEKEIAKGSAQWLSINRYQAPESKDTLAYFDKLRSQGYSIVATTPHKDDMLIDQLPLDKKVALVFGTELTGLSAAALEHADAYVKVPIYGFTESFNISVAAAISLYELTKRLRASKYDWKLSEEELVDLQLNWLIATTSLGERIEKELGS